MREKPERVRRSRFSISVFTIIILVRQKDCNVYKHYLFHLYNYNRHTQFLPFVPCAEAAGPEAHEDWADELAKRGCVDWIQFLFLTVAQVMVVEGATGQTHSLCSLVVIQQPLQLKTHKRRVRQSVGDLCSLIVIFLEIRSSRVSYHHCKDAKKHLWLFCKVKHQTDTAAPFDSSSNRKWRQPNRGLIR